MRSSQKDTEKKPDAATEIDVDTYDYNDDEYNEEFDYADQQEGDENITEYNEGEGNDENYAEEENTEGAQDQQEEYS